jgi:hypothetical protein
MDTIWKQKFLEIWLKDGDRKTKFFHLLTIIRRRQNSINAIRSDLGDWIIKKKKKEIGTHIRDKFKTLFSEEEVSCPHDLGNHMCPVITQKENTDICKIPTTEDIKRVIFELQNLKAPGPDGLPPLFYKQYWPTVGHNVTKAIQNFFVEGKMLKEINNTLIVLILKIPNPTSVNHFRPISLCNVVYKVISRILETKLRPLLDKIISPCQSALIPGRWIGEN